MAFAGYLLKVNGTIFPNRFIKIDTYQITPNQLIDDDTYTDGNGKLHRSVLEHKRTKCEFTTANISEADSVIITGFIPNTVTVNIEYWNPKKHIYETAVCYTPDITYEIHQLTATDISYKPIRLAFIEY